MERRSNALKDLPKEVLRQVALGKLEHKVPGMIPRKVLPD
jgi:hypothetical protein